MSARKPHRALSTLHDNPVLRELGHPCSRKQGHPTKRAAKRHLTDLKHASYVEDEELLNVYKCSHCGQWHVGRHNP